MDELVIKGQQAKEASRALARLSSDQKNLALEAAAVNLIERQEEILDANRKDLTEAEKQGISGALLDRLTLNASRIGSMSQGIRQLISLEDPIGEMVSMKQRPNGLVIGQKRIPLGVVGIIYEARPNVTADVAALCMKTGNAVILRGGKEAIHSNLAIVAILRDALIKAGIPANAVQLVEDTSRSSALAMMKLNKYLDVLIPRGGAGLIKTVVENSTVPVIETGVGNCHIFADASCDLNMALDILINAKTQRPGVCNAAEKLLVHTEIADEFLPLAALKLKEYGVEIRGDDTICSKIPWATVAADEDWKTEYLDLIIAIKVVASLDEAINHINTYGTGHSEAIITNNYSHAQQFLEEVDAAAVYVNASTRFTDGYEFGFGAEVGISTQKIHARGPMGLKELTTTKYIIYGNGQSRK
ncbi:MAG: glutamate-5-semialdehyde dehydrogenase [Bacteroidales bacterium]